MREPRKEVVEKFVALSRVRKGNIIPFTRVRDEIVELNGAVSGESSSPAVEHPLLMIKKKLPVAFTNYADGAGAEDRIAPARNGCVQITGKMPEDGRSVECGTAAKQRQKAGTIEDVAGGWLDSSGGKKGRIEIDVADGSVAGGPRSNGTRPANDHWHSDTALIVTSFLTAQGLLGKGNAAIVGCEQHQRVLF